MSRKHPGMLMPDGSDASSLLTPEERASVALIHSKLHARRRRDQRSIVWQERPDARRAYDEANPATWRAAVLQMYPRTQLSDGTLGRYLINEWPDVDYLAEPYEPEHFAAPQGELF